MKNPVLHVKKGAVLYDDPPAGGNLQPPRQKAQTERTHTRKFPRSPRRRGRFAWVPLAILAIVLVIVVRVVPRGPTNRATMMGWEAVLRAMPYGDMLLVSVTFIRAALLRPERTVRAQGGGARRSAGDRRTTLLVGGSQQIADDPARSDASDARRQEGPGNGQRREGDAHPHAYCPRSSVSLQRFLTGQAGFPMMRTGRGQCCSSIFSPSLQTSWRG